MPSSEIKYENVNGVMITLDIRTSNNSSKPKEFTISFKSDKKRPYLSKISLIFAIIFNIIAVTYINVNILTLCSSFIIFLFLLCLWITYSIKYGIYSVYLPCKKMLV